MICQLLALPWGKKKSLAKAPVFHGAWVAAVVIALAAMLIYPLERLTVCSDLRLRGVPDDLLSGRASAFLAVSRRPSSRAAGGNPGDNGTRQAPAKLKSFTHGIT
jgi:hypothetical protein